MYIYIYKIHAYIYTYIKWVGTYMTHVHNFLVLTNVLYNSCRNAREILLLSFFLRHREEKKIFFHKNIPR